MKFKIIAYLAGIFFMLVFVFGTVALITDKNLYFYLGWISLVLGWIIYTIAIHIHKKEN